MIRSILLSVILASVITPLSALPANPIVVNDSLAAAVLAADRIAARKADSASFAATAPLRYPPGHAATTVAVADLIKPAAFCGAFIVGGLLAMPLVKQDDEWGGLAAIPAAVTIGAAADMTAGTMVIHRMNRKYVTSSPWYATGGLLLHYAAGAGLMYLLREDRQAQELAGYFAYLTAPITATAAYVLLGKPKHGPATAPAKRP